MSVIADSDCLWSRRGHARAGVANGSMLQWLSLRRPARNASPVPLGAPSPFCCSVSLALRLYCLHASARSPLQSTVAMRALRARVSSSTSTTQHTQPTSAHTRLNCHGVLHVRQPHRAGASNEPGVANRGSPGDRWCRSAAARRRHVTACCGAGACPAASRDGMLWGRSLPGGVTAVSSGQLQATLGTGQLRAPTADSSR